MKKSVVIPYERYQQLMQNQRGAAASALVNHQEIKKLPPLDGAEESKSQIHKLDSSVIVACLPKRNRSKAQQILEYIDKQWAIHTRCKYLLAQSLVIHPVKGWKGEVKNRHSNQG